MADLRATVMGGDDAILPATCKRHLTNPQGAPSDLTHIKVHDRLIFYPHGIGISQTIKIPSL